MSQPMRQTDEITHTLTLNSGMFYKGLKFNVQPSTYCTGIVHNRVLSTSPYTWYSYKPGTEQLCLLLYLPVAI
jgi:hypothetical protein